MITRALVKIDGIISVAFNPEQRLCIIRARRARPEVFGLAVANLGFECSLVTKNEKKEIVRHIFCYYSHKFHFFVLVYDIPTSIHC